MTEQQKQELCRVLGNLLVGLQYSVPVKGRTLRDRDISQMVGISTKTYSKLKKARKRTSLSI